MSIVLTFSAALISYIFYYVFIHRLSRYPGPLLAKITNIWRLINVRKGSYQETLRDLHRQYGSVVRIGPNLLSLSDPRWTKIIYSTRGEFKKSNAYSANDVRLPGGIVVPTTFSVLDNNVHAEMMKPIQKLYNLNQILTYEAQVDEVIDILERKLSSFTDGRVVDIGDQLLYFAYDTISNITLGKPDGYLEKQSDFEGVIRISVSVFEYFAAVMQVPWLDRWLAKSKSDWVSSGFASFSQMHNKCAAYINARINDKTTDKHSDFLEDFIEIGGGRSNPDFPIIIAWLSNNVVAGSDTVAIQLKAAIYYTLKHPAVLEKLLAELDAAQLATPISYRDAKDKLPYLDAVIRESMRLHPAVGLPLERIVPVEGVQLPDGPYLEGGTYVGMNPWVVHSSDIFGPDPGSFVPERWFPVKGESAIQHAARLAQMNSADLTFGAGRRICSGKFVGLVEIYKVLPALFLHFDLELVNAGKEWSLNNSWFVYQKGIEVYVKRRQK